MNHFMKIFFVYFFKQNISILNAESLKTNGMQLRMCFNPTKRFEVKRAPKAWLDLFLFSRKKGFSIFPCLEKNSRWPMLFKNNVQWLSIRKLKRTLHTQRKVTRYTISKDQDRKTLLLIFNTTWQDRLFLLKNKDTGV